MTSFSLPLSSLSLCFPKSSVPYLGLRPPPAPPPESLSPPTPPEPPDPPDPPDPQICSSSGETHAQSLIFQHLTSPQRVLRDSEPPSPSPSQPPLRLGSPSRKSIPMSIPAFASPRCRRWMLISRFSKVKLGFHCLGQNLVLCLLGQKWMDDLLGHMWRVLFLGSTSPTPSPLLSLYRLVSGLISLESSSPIKPRLLLNFVAINDACSFITPSIPFTQGALSSRLFCLEQKRGLLFKTVPAQQLLTG